MSTHEVQLERRAGQRFDYNLRVAISVSGREEEGSGVTQNLSAKGIFFQTDFSLTVGDAVEIVVVMPSEITLGDNMRVRCRGKVLRVTPLSEAAQSLVGVQIEGYQYLADEEVASRGLLFRDGLDENAIATDSTVPS